mmetsp:Transcript_55915/g.130936  ORF Transcript_55915/g.130936 Transcript_55915/m.130936 type:complete len:152 (+) Transcript_55915:64-519(+)
MGNQETCCCQQQKFAKPVSVSVRHSEADIDPHVAFRNASSGSSTGRGPSLADHIDPAIEKSSFSVELEKGERDIGLQIRMCVARRVVLIAEVKPGTCASEWNAHNPSKQLRPNQRILEVNDHCVRRFTLKEIAMVICNSERVKLLITIAAE